jgi:hypothetical protein
MAQKVLLYYPHAIEALSYSLHFLLQQLEVLSHFNTGMPKGVRSI